MPSRSLLLVAFAFAFPACNGASAGVPRVDGAEARRLVAEGAVLLDVRTPREFARGHAEPAVNVPLGELAARLDELPRDRPVITYCMAGARSRQAAAALEEAGFDVRDLGSLSAWEAAPGGAPTER